MYHRDLSLDLYYSIFSWMACFFLSTIAIYIIMLMKIPCLHRQNLSIYEAMALLKADYENAVSWFTSNGIKENPGKFQLIIVPPLNVTDKKPELLVSDVLLKPETSVKVLGITIDSRLNFSQHVSNLCTKVAWHLMPLLAFTGTSMKRLEIWFTTPSSEAISISALRFGIFVEYRIMKNLRWSKSVL